MIKRDAANWKLRRLTIHPLEQGRKPFDVTYYTHSDDQALQKAKRDYAHMARITLHMDTPKND